MVGVLVDHWNECALFPGANGCPTLQAGTIAKWAEVFTRSIGNDQCMFGFIGLGAFQDSATQVRGKPWVRIGFQDLFIFLVYLAFAWPIPQILYVIFPPPLTSRFSDNMYVNSYISGHRWYLLMVLGARLEIALFQLLRVPAFVQVGLHTVTIESFSAHCF